jgi:hypothetical protein
MGKVGEKQKRTPKIKGKRQSDRLRKPLASLAPIKRQMHLTGILAELAAQKRDKERI